MPLIDLNLGQAMCCACITYDTSTAATTEVEGNLLCTFHAKEYMSARKNSNTGNMPFMKERRAGGRSIVSGLGPKS